MLYSFDVFDTLITRRSSSPQGIFLYMQEILQRKIEYSDVAHDYVIKRADAENSSRLFFKNKEINIDDIYDVLAQKCHLSSYQRRELLELEINLEEQNVIPIQRNIELLKEYKQNGGKVILISDMYLPSQYIKRILSKVDAVFTSIPIYVSCDCNAKKVDGSLYRFVRNKECAKCEEWVHYGDDLVADINVPELLGIKAKRVERYLPSFFEQKLSSRFCSEYDVESQRFLGLIKEVCLDKNSNLFRLGAICGAGVLVPYIEWIIDEAIKRHVCVLLFMARDGYIMKEIADRLIYEKELGIKTEYLYVSRDTLRDKGSVGEKTAKYVNQFINEQSVAFVDFDGTGKSLISLAQRLEKKIIGFYYFFEGTPQGKDYQFFSYTHLRVSSAVFETICRAPHGKVIDYEEKSGKMEPVMEMICEETWKKAGLFTYIEGVLSYTEKYIVINKNTKNNASFLKIGKYLISYCENESDKTFMDYFGDFPHSENGKNEICGYAPILKVEDLEEIYGKRGNEPIEDYYKGSNIEFSFRRSNKGCTSIYNYIRSRTNLNVKKRKNAQRFVVYAAGKYGFEAWYRMQNSENNEVVAWVDLNYQKYDDILIQSPLVIKDMDYDFVMICISSRDVFEAVREMLKDMGIENKKIIWIKDYWKDFVI